MMIGMTRVKIAVSLPEDLVDAARAAVRTGRAPSVSAYVETALVHQTEADELDEWLAENLRASGGAMTEEERAWADEVLDAAPARRSTRAR